MHDEELHNFSSLTNIVSLIKSRMKSQWGYAVNVEERRNAYRILVGKPEQKVII
jgi:hypothetical protein